jgi:hypothetical protein
VFDSRQTALAKSEMKLMFLFASIKASTMRIPPGQPGPTVAGFCSMHTVAVPPLGTVPSAMFTVGKAVGTFNVPLPGHAACAVTPPPPLHQLPPLKTHE